MYHQLSWDKLPTLAMFMLYRDIDSEKIQLILHPSAVCWKPLPFDINNSTCPYLPSYDMLFSFYWFCPPETGSRHWFFSRRKLTEGPNDSNEKISGSSYVVSKARKTFGASSISELSFSSSQAFTYPGSTNASIDQESNHQNLGDNNQEILTVKSCNSMASTKREQVNYFMGSCLLL